VNNDWWEITTHSNDPSRIEMRRLSDEEAEAARKEEAKRLAEQILSRFTGWRDEVFLPLVDNIMEVVNETVVSIDDEKQKRRQRVKDDVRKKRKEMFKSRGRR
jgi:hypothetical protein